MKIRRIFIFVFMTDIYILYQSITMWQRNTDFWVDNLYLYCITLDFVNYFQIFITTLFIGINIWIVLADIRKRRIPNIAILCLLGLLPIWYIAFPILEISEIAIYAAMSLILLIWGIGIYRENGFLGSGDIKYASIIILYLVPYSLPLYMGNVGSITLIILVFWISMILGHLLAIRSLMNREDLVRILPEISLRTVIYGLWNTFLDWCIIGFFLYLALRSVTTLTFEYISLDQDFYFLLMLLIFLSRPRLRYILTKWEYHIYPILGICIYYGVAIRDIGIWGIWIEGQAYLMGIWRYALVFILLQIIANTVFQLYNIVINKSESGKILYTIPYSLVIFAGFATLVWGHWDLMTMLKAGF